MTNPGKPCPQENLVSGTRESNDGRADLAKTRARDASVGERAYCTKVDVSVPAGWASTEYQTIEQTPEEFDILKIAVT